MARTAKIAKSLKKPKFKVRVRAKLLRQCFDDFQTAATPDLSRRRRPVV